MFFFFFNYFENAFHTAGLLGRIAHDMVQGMAGLAWAFVSLTDSEWLTVQRGRVYARLPLYVLGMMILLIGVEMSGARVYVEELWLPDVGWGLSNVRIDRTQLDVG